ncbi:MAG: linear amide C-N hydrolase, partial [Candidatus Saccharibacteria bacterium]|nr:linear amide C-N hydrolase [Candidatus Saccharibacteria bacterium]
PNELLNSTEINEKINVAAYEFPLYVALNFSTVDEAAEALKNVVIVDKPINEKFPTSPLHYFIADKSRSIVVEYTKNGMEIYDNDTDILTNQPGFTWHRENLRNYMNIFPNFPRSATWGLQKTTGTRPNAELLPFGTGALMQGLPGGYSPADRFIRAAYFNTHYPVQTSETENVSRLFKTLSAVSMIEGAGLASDGKFEITIYTSCYSSAEKTYYYNTYHDMALKKVAFADFPLDNGTLITAS